MATAERVKEDLEEKSQEDCALKSIHTCDKICPANCRHYFSINDRKLSEQEIERKYLAFRKDKNYNFQ